MLNHYERAILALYRVYYYTSGQFGYYSSEFIVKEVEQIAKNILLDHEQRDRQRRAEAEQQRANEK